MNFYNIDDIYLKLQKIYNKGDIFKNYIENKDLFPIKIRLKKVQEKDIQGYFSVLLHKIKTLKESKLPIEYQEFSFKRIGTQLLPVLIKIDTVEEYLDIINKQEYYDNFILNYHKVIFKYPNLKDLIYQKPMLVLEYSLDWDKFFLIIDFFISNKKPNIYIREISLENIDTKYIEKHIKILDILLSNLLGTDTLKNASDMRFEKKYNLKYQLPQVRFRIIDDDLSICGLKDLTLPINEFESLIVKCKKVFIVENKITFLAFPKIDNSIVIFGSGYSIGILQNTKWLSDKEIYYWGDIDIDGFAILSQIRGYFNHVESILMTSEIIEKFKNRAVSYQNKTVRFPTLVNLTVQEMIVYTKLIDNFYGINFRLEQEKLPLELII